MIHRRDILPRPAAIAALLLAAVLAPARPARATDISAGLMAGEPTYRELRLAADLGLLRGPLPGRQPLSRAEAFRLLRPVALDLVGGGPDSAAVVRRLGPATAYRLERAARYLSPWDDFWAKDEYPITLWGWMAKRRALDFSEIEDGKSTPHELGYGYDYRQGLAGEWDHAFFVEAEGFALDVYGRLRWDANALTYRPLTLTLRTGWRNVRAVLGREPLSWGPAVHGNLLLTTNALPLDQLRLETESPFALPGPLARAGRFTASAFLAHLDDPHRHDYPSPWLTGTRLTWSPARWLLFGVSRTVLLGGEGNRFIVTPASVWDVVTGSDENRVGGDRRNDTDQIASVDWSVYLWPLLRPVPVLDGGRLYGEYGGEDSPQSGPLPSAPGHTYGLELVAGGVLVRAEASNAIDDKNLWYWHVVYTDGYTYRDRVLGHPMGGDSRAQSYDLEVPVGRWGLVTAGMTREEHGFNAEAGVPPYAATKPVPHGVQDTWRLAVEKYLGSFPGAIRVEGRALRTWGDRDRLGPLEKWGVTVEWRR